MKFTAPLLLYALSLVVIPILIHLFNLRRYRTVYFSNVRFLRDIKEETQKQSRLRHLLILFSRIFAIIFLVLAFARPYIPEESQAIITNKDLVSLYVDNSFSMEAEGSEGELLTRAKQKASEITSSFRATDDFRILDNSFSDAYSRLYTREELSGHISDIDFSHSFRSVSEIIARQQSYNKNSPYQQHFQYIISDFQKSFTDFENIISDSSSKIFLIPVQPNETANLYIDTLWFDVPTLRQGEQVVLKARIENRSDKPYENVPVRLFTGENQRALSSFSIAENSEAIIEMPFNLTESGILHAWLEITDYPVTFDDRLYFSCYIPERIGILCINESVENPYLNALFSKDSSFTYSHTGKGAIDFSRLGTQNLIILNGINDMPSGMASELSKYVEEGGAIMLIPGATLNIESINAFPALSGLNYGRGDTTALFINKINLTHPLYKNVFESIPDNVALPSVRKHYPISIPTGSLTEQILTLQNGMPFLTVTQVGKGTVYMMASPLEKNFTNFQQHGIFVPTVFNMALSALPLPELYYTLGTDNAIALKYINSDIKSVFRIKSTTNDFEFIPGFSSSYSQVVFTLNGMPEEAGNYNVFNNELPVGGMSFNYNRKESETDCYSAEELNSMIKEKQLSGVYVVDTSKESIGQTITKMNSGIVLWKYCIIFALIFLLAEVLLLRFMK